MQYGVLIHDIQDDVGVAVLDLPAGSEFAIATLEGQHAGSVKLIEDVPLGHKVALRDLAEGQDVIEYRHPIGRATQAIARGAHVHVHNIKTKRW